MPRAFTAEEKARIRDDLLEVGEERFARFGLKKTSIADLTEPAGIAKSSFYLFFESKEELYVELMMRKIPEMMRRLLAASFEATSEVREAIVLFQQTLIREMETDELARALLADTQQLMQLVARLHPEALRTRAMPLAEPLIQAIRDAQWAGKIIDGDPEEIVQMFGMIKILPLYKDKIIDQLRYPRLVDLMSQVIADGLTCPARMRKEER